MDAPTSVPKKDVIHLIPFILIGIGLIIIGAVTAGYLSGNNAQIDYTIVPSEVNFPAPDLQLKDLQGNLVSIADFRNQIVLINNWATWCPPCKEETPTLLKYYEAHKDQGFVIIGIEAGDPEKDITRFVEEYRLTYPILVDPNNRSLALFHNDSLPSSYVINHDGNVVLAWTGPISNAMLEKFVSPLLEK